MTKHKTPHRLKIESYNKTCPICLKQFYDKSINYRKYCSKECSEIGYKGRHRKSEAKHND